MSKLGYLSRYLLIIKKIEKTPYTTYEALKFAMDHEFYHSQMQDEVLKVGFSKRTLQRDIKEIRKLYGIDVEYSYSEKGYFISQSEHKDKFIERKMEVFEMFNALNLTQDLSSIIHLENRKPQGTDNLNGLIHAIKKRVQIMFVYQNFSENDFAKRIAEPYGLKEFKNRWYVMAKDCKDKVIKSFALDRLTELEITNQTFLYPENYNIEEAYRYCFGIISPNANAPETIRLSFEPFQGKYIKTLPLHHTQQILLDNDKETRIQLKLYLTHDLIMELLSYGDSLRVIEPKSLIKQIKTAHEKASKQY